MVGCVAEAGDWVREQEERPAGGDRHVQPLLRCRRRRYCGGRVWRGDGGSDARSSFEHLCRSLSRGGNTLSRQLSGIGQGDRSLILRNVLEREVPDVRLVQC